MPLRSSLTSSLAYRLHAISVGGWGGEGEGLTVTDPQVRSFPRQIANILKIIRTELGSHLLLCTVYSLSSGLEINSIKNVEYFKQFYVTMLYND